MSEEIKKQCRYLRPDGVQCLRPALRNEAYCFHHGRDRRHTRYTRTSPALIQIPLLDNRAAIQTVLTDVARALAAGTLEVAISRELVSVLKVASQQLPRPSASIPVPSVATAVSAPELPSSVDEITLTPEGDELGPDLPYHGPNGKPAREWSFSEFLYRSVFSPNPGQPLPEDGYIDPAKGPTAPPASRLVSPSGPEATPVHGATPAESAGSDPTPAPGSPRQGYIARIEATAACPSANRFSADRPSANRFFANPSLAHRFPAALHEPHLKPAQLLGQRRRSAATPVVFPPPPAPNLRRQSPAGP